MGLKDGWGWALCGFNLLSLRRSDWFSLLPLIFPPAKGRSNPCCMDSWFPPPLLVRCVRSSFLQPDFGTCFLCGAVAATMMFQAGTSLRWLLPAVSLAILVFSILVYFDPHRIRRVTSFLDVEANANDSSFQLWQGMLAFGVGGVNGVGLGMARQQVHFLPEAHTDFILPVIGEELGLVYTLGIVLCFLVMYVGVSLRLLHAPRLYEYLLAMGALLFVSLQAIINIGVVTGSMPTKGMSLPFISYGGSNLMVTFIFVGLIINAFRRWDNPKSLKPREL